MKFIDNTTKKAGEWFAHQHIHFLDFHANNHLGDLDEVFPMLIDASKDYDIIIDKSVIILSDKE